MGTIEKTIFISYRRRNVAWAIAIFQNLTLHGYDVFFDYNGLASGDFEQVILGNINSRAHFIVLLTPSALDRCSKSDDWLRREMEHAISTHRNIVPLMLENFSFGKSKIKRQLTGKLADLSHYSGLEVYPSYFNEAMERLRKQHLNVALDAVTHPASRIAQEAARAQQAAARIIPPIRETELTAEELFDQLKKPIDFKRDKRAVTWFRKAAETGNPYGMAGLGFMYVEGRGGLRKDETQAANWYRKAAEGGAARGMSGLGVMYANGEGGLPKDEMQALSWFQKAAEIGDGRGMVNLGVMYAKGGGGLPKDETQALSWFRKAADAGDGRGMASLGIRYENGEGGLPKNETQAANWYRKAAEAGDSRGMVNLGDMYENGKGGLPRDEAQAVDWYLKAAEAGNDFAKAALKRLGLSTPF